MAWSCRECGKVFSDDIKTPDRICVFCPSTVTVPREEWERMRRDNETMMKALVYICYHGSDKPAGMGGTDPDDDVSWWKYVARNCMYRAMNALRNLTPSNAESKPTGKGE